jgi:hypothetical protein
VHDMCSRVSRVDIEEWGDELEVRDGSSEDSEGVYSRYEGLDAIVADRSPSTYQ